MIFTCEFSKEFAIIGCIRALIEQTTNLISLPFNLFKTLNLSVTVSALGLNLSCGKVSHAGKFTTLPGSAKDLSSAVSRSDALVEVVIKSKGDFWLAASRA